MRTKDRGLILIFDRGSVHKRGRRLLKEELEEEEMDKLYVEWRSVRCGFEPALFSSTREYDPEKAIELLAVDGWKDSDGDGILEKNGKELKFKLWSSTESTMRKIAEVVQDMWRKIGAKAEIQLFDEAALRDKLETGEHDAVLWRHEWAGYDMYYRLFNPKLKKYPAITHFDTPKLRELIEKNKASTTYEEFKSTAVGLANYFYKHAPANALVYPEGVVAVLKYVKNFEPRGKGWACGLPICTIPISRRVINPFDSKLKIILRYTQNTHPFSETRTGEYSFSLQITKCIVISTTIPTTERRFVLG